MSALLFLMDFCVSLSKVKVRLIYLVFFLSFSNYGFACGCSACQATLGRTARSKSTSASRIHARTEALASTWWDTTSARVLPALWVRKQTLIAS